MRVHPFDILHGVSTSGHSPGWLLDSVGSTDEQNAGYAGCQPSCLRYALSAVPEPSRFAFFDLGCGKGRSLIVASEFRFRRVAGVEIAPELCKVARANAAVIRKAYPERTPIEVFEGDATRAPLPEGDLVVFIYHSFGVALVRRIVARLVGESDHRAVVLVYQNPVYGDVLDAVPAFRRWDAKTIPCDPEELGFAPDASETVVTWVLGLECVTPKPGAEAAIVGTPWRADLVMPPQHA